MSARVQRPITEAERRQAAYNLVGAWNHLCPPSTAVAVSLEAGGPEYATRTRGRAWPAGPNAFVLVEGIRGGHDLKLVRPRTEGEKLEPIPTLPEPGDPEAGGGAA
jgi:hypothetical protein